MTKRLLLGYLTVTVVVLLLLEVPLGLFYAQREVERLTAELDRDASVIATIYEDDLERGRPLDPGPAELYEQRTDARVVVVDQNGISRVDTDQATPRDLSTRPEIATALQGRRASGTRPSDTLGTDLLFVAVPVASGGVVHGALRVTLDASRTTAAIHRFWAGLAAVAAVVVATMALVGWGIARSVTRPVRRLQRSAERFASGDLRSDPAGHEHGPPELRALATTMATMAERLAAVLDEQRAFVADASHQLRTPLTALRLRLENLQARMPDADAAELDAAIEETDRLTVLVNELLQLARTDRHREPEPQDLRPIALDRVDTWSALAETRRAKLVSSLAPDGGALMVHAVPGSIEQILDNVLDNALKVSPDGGVITVGVERHGRQVALWVQDDGPGLSDEDKERALRRFWRGDTTTPGSGLGLPIVASLARASGATLQLTDNPTGGLRVTITFTEATPR